jgi:type IV pilus assembly protein PilW
MNVHGKPSVARMRRGQKGFTLIELSVAVMIGLFLLGGLLTLVHDMRRTFGAQNGLAQLQDNERLAMTLITDVIQAAGYFPDPTTQTAGGATGVLPAVLPFTSSGQSIAGTGNLAAPGDTITVQYFTANNDGVINCKGGTNASGGNFLYVNKFSVVKDPLTNKWTLSCTLLGVTYPLVSDVTNMQIWYGVKRNNAVPGNNVDTYLTAASGLMTPGDWNSVICIKVTLTFINPLNATQPTQPPTIQFTRVITVMNRAGVNTT